MRLGLQERRTRIRCVDDYSSRGLHTTEEKIPELTAEIQALVEPESQADPKFQTPLAYTRMTAKAVHAAVSQQVQPHRVPARRDWGVLENHWNGALLNTLETALKWAQTMTWRGVAPLVQLLDRTYDTGVRLTKRLFQPFANRLLRSTTLPKWSLTIHPHPR